MLKKIHLAMSALVLVACSDDPTEAIDPGPTGNPSIAFTDPAPSGGPTCVSVGEDADVQIPLLVDVDEMELRPPGGCDGISQCGHLALYADDVLNNETSVQAVALLVHKLGDPYHDGAVHQGTGEPDLLTVRVDIVNDDGTEVVLDHDGEELTDAVELITVPDCSALE